MKNKLVLMLTLGFVVITFALNAQTPNEKLLTSRLSSYRYADLIVAAKDSLLEYEFFKTQAYNKLNENERTIDAFVVALEKKKKKVRNRCFPRVAELEKRNEALKMSIRGYKPGTQKNWFVFRRNFNLAMGDLSADLSNLGIEQR